MTLGELAFKLFVLWFAMLIGRVIVARYFGEPMGAVFEGAYFSFTSFLTFWITTYIPHHFAAP